MNSDITAGPIARPRPQSWALAQTLNDPAVNRVLAVIGRLGLVYLFCFSAVYHLTFGWATTINEMVARHVPFSVPLMVLAQIAAVTFTLAIAFNVQARWAALGLALYVVTVSSIIYTPGTYVSGPDTRIFFMKDMAIFGALLLLSCALSANQRLAAELKSLKGASAMKL